MRSLLIASFRRYRLRAPGVFLCVLAVSASDYPLVAAQEAGLENRPARVSTVIQLVAVGPAARGNEEECTGTGFFVNAEGAILSAAHVVEEARRCLEGVPGGKIVAKFPGSNPNMAGAISCDLVGLERNRDLAVLKTERPPQRVFMKGPSSEGVRSFPDGRLLLDSTDVPTGTQVFVTGHTGRTWRAVTLHGHVMARKSLILLESPGVESDVFVLDIPLKRGASGSPVYLQNGLVIGVVVETDPEDPGHTIAVSSRYCLALLSRLHIPFDKLSSP